MEEVKNGTPSAVQEEQPTEAQNQPTEPEYRLTDDGSVEGDFSDWELQKEEEQSQPEAEQKYYTPEEIQKIGIDKLDPNRIPPELQPWYKSMQADYTRKTQAVAEERKAVEKLLDKALSHPALAQEFINDPELVGLAQKHPELAQKLQAVSQMAQPEQQNLLDLLTEQAKRIVEAQLGEEFDEFNPKHLAAFNLAVSQLQQQMAQTQAIQSRIQQLAQSEPHFAEIDQYAQQKLSQLPYAEAVKIVQAAQTGDIDTLLKFWNECRKEWYNQNLNKPQQQTQQEPPPVESSGKGEVETQSAISPEDFAYLDDDQKAQALIKLGLV